jgi:hypothetical protein
MFSPLDPFSRFCTDLAWSCAAHLGLLAAPSFLFRVDFLIAQAGLTNSAHFAKIHRNLTNSGRPNSKIIGTVHCFKISEKDKNQQKYVQKLDRILSLLVMQFL